MPDRLRRLLLPLLLVAAALGTAGCEVSVGDKTLDAGSVEEAIKTSQEDAGQTVSEVDCPGGEKVEQGRSFDCTVTLGNGRERTARVELVDDEGTFNYELLPAGDEGDGEGGTTTGDTGGGDRTAEDSGEDTSGDGGATGASEGGGDDGGSSSGDGG